MINGMSITSILILIVVIWLILKVARFAIRMMLFVIALAVAAGFFYFVLVR